MTQPPEGTNPEQPQWPAPAPPWTSPPGQYGQPTPPPGQYRQPTPPPGQYGQPDPYGQPPQYGQPTPPPYGQPPQYGQPTPPPQQFGPGQPYAQPGQWDYLSPNPTYQPPAPPKRGRGKLIAALVAVVVLAGGGVASYVAVSDKGSSASGGSSTPQAAVTSLVADLNKSDLLGILDHLAPGERDAIVDPLTDSINTAKRLHVITPDANPSQVSGASYNAKDITFDKSTDTVNDHVQIVHVTGGTISVDSDFTKIPFTAEFMKVAFPNGLPSNVPQHQQVNIAQVVSNNGGQPIRIATEKVGGKWYPSIMYTIADYASNGQVPSASDYVAPNGGSSPEDAVTQMINASIGQDYKRLIELASPDELGVVHDYAGEILKNAPGGALPVQDFKITNLSLASKAISGGSRVTLKSISFQDGSGDTGTLSINGSCVSVSSGGASQQFCAQQAVSEINKARSTPLTADQQAAFEHLFAGLPNIGIDTSESGGKWYINPIRTYFDLTNSLLSGLQNNALLTPLAMIPR